MESFNFVKILSVISVFILSLLILFLCTVKSDKKLSNKLFACYIFLTAINASGYFISDTIISVYANLEIFRWTIILLNIPLFYLYVLSLCYDDFRLKIKHFLHAIPFFIINLVLFSRIYWTNEIEKNYFFGHHSETSEMILFQYLMEFQYLFYIIYIFEVIKKSRKIFIENYSDSNNSIFKWLFQLTVVFVISHYFATFKNLLRYTDYHQLLIFINAFLEIISLIVTSWVVLKALKYPEFFRGINTKLQLVNDFGAKPILEAKEKKNIKNITINIQIELLRKYIINEKPYLNSSLTIQDLATQMNMPVRDLSILINSNMNHHFFDFVNQYRIENAMELLRNHCKSDFTVLEILYKVGFNSKSSFNTAFKKHTALTPTEYRNKFSKIN